ncbi:MAG: beta-N-acetylglucosaminidase domain-containing protein [Clostridia bacterium]|nr:beta-N-acetylglucosaminidase domain-containing protein [Clostridia bacterium]
MIYPIPQKYELNGKEIIVKSVSISGEFKEIAERVFKDYAINCINGLNVVFKYENSKDTTYCDDTARLTDEKYIIIVSENEVIVKASCEKGAFRGAHTLAKLIVKNELKEGTLIDYPLFKTRGYIEGFYGHTWENSKRLSVMKLMASYGMNTFFYAPKDDIYHREKWRELYPENELTQLKNLFDYACENYFDFHWTIGPGLTYKYTSDEDFTQLINKIKSVYDIGVRNFGLLLDDIPWDFQYEDDKNAFDSVVDAHIFLVNKTYTALKEIDSSIKLTVCPTQYSGNCNEYYITKFGCNIPADVDVFWTGDEICSRVITVREADEFTYATNHRPLYWDNYPVNDCEMFQEMHMGAYIGRDKELYKHSEGIISNVMEYAECSKIPLMTVADFLWNPIAYKPDESLKNAHQEILGNDADIFALFADHLCVSCLSRYASSYMGEILSKVSFLEASDRKDESLKLLCSYISDMKKCLTLISDTNVPLFAELQKWVRKFAMCCDLLDDIYTAKENPTQENKNMLLESLQKYNSDGTILTGFCLREMAEKTIAKI